MFKFFFKNISGFFLVLILIICLWLLTHRGSNQFFQATSYKISALDTWLPIQKSVDWLISFPENTFNAIRELRILQQENSRLQIENQSLHTELSNQKSLESELIHLKEMLQIKA